MVKQEINLESKFLMLFLKEMEQEMLTELQLDL